MRKITVREETVEFADAKFIVSASVEIIPLNTLEQHSDSYLTLAERINAGEQTIDIQNCLTGRIDTISIEQIVSQVPDAATGQFVVRTSSSASIAPDSPGVPSAEAFHAERKRRGLD